jgi:hypothetical protein
MRMRRRRDTVAVVVIWVFVIAVALLLAAYAGDENLLAEDGAGVGQTAGAAALALTGLYFYVRRLRGRRGLMRRATLWRSPGGAQPGSVTLTWLKVVVAILLWIAGSVVAIVAHVPDALAFWLGALLPLAVFVGPRLRRYGRDLRSWPGPRRSRRSR